MRRSFFIILMLVITVFSSVELASAQFKIPKIPKPKSQPTPTETAQPTESQPDQPQPEARTATRAPASGGPYAVKPAAPDTPMLLAETLEIWTETFDYYTKAPGQSYYVSWAPRLRFSVNYGGALKLRFKADYTMPDGSPWFSETLDWRGGSDDPVSAVESPSSTEADKRAIVTPGLFGLKITNLRDNSVFFQGKFKVVRYRPQDVDARYKNWFDFYVDQDWLLPIGHTDLEWSSVVYADPSIQMWFKGGIESSDLEARLFYNGKELATTDDGGNVEHLDGRFPKRAGNDPALHWQLFRFSWPKKTIFIVTDESRNYTSNANKVYINQMPGEYTVKIFYKGEQIRETKFNIANGDFADNGLAKQNRISTNKVLLPVKVMGTADKWNPINAKADGFYGGPLTGLMP